MFFLRAKNVVIVEGPSCSFYELRMFDCGRSVVFFLRAKNVLIVEGPSCSFYELRMY